jgi:hypothetical protein
VSAFPESVQQSAFDSLMAAAGAAVAPAPGPASGEVYGQTPTRKSGTPSPQRKRRQADEAGGTKSRRAVSSQPKLVKELDLRPKGKKSFSDFVNEKNPMSNHDKNAVAVYYLANVAGISPVTRDQVYTAYREMGWKLPNNFANSLQLTATKKRYLDTSDADDLRLLNPGLNRVEQDMPKQKQS